MAAHQRLLAPRPRRDGWTAERQLRFLGTLARTASVTRAAASAGMSRESAYRLRGRHVLFAALWDRAIGSAKGHSAVTPEKRSVRISRGNPPKATKWRKWKNPGFHALLKELRELPFSTDRER